MSGPGFQEGSILLREPKGSIETGLLGNSYLSTAPSTLDDTHTPAQKAVLVLTDGCGLDTPNPKLIADEIASQLQCDVWFRYPNFIGRALIPVDFATLLPDRPGEKITWWHWIKFIFTVGIPNIGVFLANRPSRVEPRLEEFILKLKEEKKYERIGAVGYWYGGSVAIRFASRPDLLNTVVIRDPGRFTVDNVRNFKIANSWVCAEDDQWFPISLRHQCEAELASRKDKEIFVEYEFRTYQGTAHGFTAHPNLEVPEVKTAFEGALMQTVEWLKKTL